MATYGELNLITKARNKFVLNTENAIKEIRDKFADFRSQLDQGELNLIDTLEKTQVDILQKFDEITPKLKEIQQCRDSVISILTKNSNKQFLETQLCTFTTEIDGIIGKSEIDKLIKLKWECSSLEADTICQITLTTLEKETHLSFVSGGSGLSGLFNLPNPTGLGMEPTTFSTGTTSLFSSLSSSSSYQRVIPLLKRPNLADFGRKRRKM